MFSLCQPARGEPAPECFRVQVPLYEIAVTLAWFGAGGSIGLPFKLPCKIKLGAHSRGVRKAKNMKLIFAVLLASFTVVLAQDKLADFRMVDGHLYNIQRSILWEDYQGDCLKVSNKLITVQLFTMQPVYGASSKSVEVRGDTPPRWARSHVV